MRKELLVAVFVSLLGCAESEVDDADAVTWYRDVLPVVQTRCLGCHNDEVGPFSMARWTPELGARASLMAALTESGAMPPWKPSPDCNSYRDERRLQPAEQAVFTAWAEGGGLEGNPEAAPPPPQAPADLAWVDVSLGLEAPFTPAPPSGEDVHHCFVLDPALDDASVMIGYHVRPGDARVVHHVLLYLVDGAAADTRDAGDPELGYACSGGVGIDDARPIAGWVPGTPATRFPSGTGVTLMPGEKIVMQMHYNVAASGPLPDQTAVDLQLAREPVENTAIITPLADRDFAIPPGAENWETATQMSIPGAATIWGVGPHMHQLGRHIRVEIEHGDGTSSCLVDIPAWDFDWQQFYFLQNPVNVEASDIARLRCVWDNTLDSTVTWGEDTSSEMCVAYFYATGR